jgi:hypothetical protein
MVNFSGAATQKKAIFVLTAVRTSNPAYTTFTPRPEK